MTRLDFRLPEFTRYAWVSDRAREVWGPRITRIQAAWSEIEWRSVAAGVRPCAHRIVEPAALEALTARMAGAGLAVACFGEVGWSASPYTSASAPAVPGQPVALRVAIGSPEANAAFCAAWAAGDQARIGESLGYPACCQRFFQRVWVDERCMDTTWAMAASHGSASGPDAEQRTRRVAGPREVNILLRWLGVRAVPHLPCRFDCAGSVEFASKLIAVGRDAGFTEEMDWLLEMLAWPVEWSALHGIAEIRTPVIKISAATDATAERYEVRREGDGYPAEGARGLQFPYRAPERLRVLSSIGFRRGLENPIVVPPAAATTAPASAPISAPASAPAPADPRAAWFAERRDLFAQNGYRTLPRAIYEAFLDVVDRPGATLELGCGNGLLLRFLRDHSPHALDCSGIDLNGEAIRIAQALVFPEHARQFFVEDVRSCELQASHYALVITNPIYADPGYYEQSDGQIRQLRGEGLIARYVRRCVEALAPGGRLILFLYPEQTRQLAPFRETFDRELTELAPRVQISPAADLTFFLIER